jgi:hypothetical protein
MKLEINEKIKNLPILIKLSTLKHYNSLNKYSDRV